jgi:hypothetical protein
MEWKPIDTAPRDGTPVELCRAGGPVYEIAVWRWNAGCELWFTMATGLDWEWAEDEDGPTHYRLPVRPAPTEAST